MKPAPGAGRQTGTEERRREGPNGSRPGPPHVPRYPADASKKNPQLFRRGKVGGWLIPASRPDPSPAKGDPGKLPVGPVSWLPVTNLLSAPSRRISPSGLGADFVAGYSCGAAMDFHHLPDTHDRAPDGNLRLLYRYLPFLFAGCQLPRVTPGNPCRRGPGFFSAYGKRYSRKVPTGRHGRERQADRRGVSSPGSRNISPFDRCIPGPRSSRPISPGRRYPGR